MGMDIVIHLVNPTRAALVTVLTYLYAHTVHMGVGQSMTAIVSVLEVPSHKGLIV